MASISSNRRLLDPFSRYIFRIYANEISQAQGIVDWAVGKHGVKRPAMTWLQSYLGQ